MNLSHLLTPVDPTKRIVTKNSSHYTSAEIIRGKQHHNKHFQSNSSFENQENVVAEILLGIPQKGSGKGATFLDAEATHHKGKRKRISSTKTREPKRPRLRKPAETEEGGEGRGGKGDLSGHASHSEGRLEHKNEDVRVYLGAENYKLGTRGT